VIRKGEFLSTSNATAAKATAKKAGAPPARNPSRAAATKPAPSFERKPAKKSTKDGNGQSKPKKKSIPGEVPRRPTHKLRHRALSNRIKSKLLGDAHDPTRAQAKDVVAAAMCGLGEGTNCTSWRAASLVDSPVVDKRTFEKWWRGTVGRVWTPKLEACDRLVKGSSLWLNNSFLGEPVQRHMDALDVRCDDRVPKKLDGKRGEAWLAERMDLTDKCLQAADLCWSVFSHRAVPSKQALTLMAQVTPRGTIPAPRLTYAPPTVRADHAAWLDQDDFNPYMFEADTVARRMHNASSKFGLLRFLLRLGTAAEGSEPWWHVGWVFDLASVAAMAQFFSIFGPAGSPESNVGEDADLIFAINRVFFDHEDGTITPFVTDLPKFAKRLDLPPLQFVKSLMAARSEYYSTLEALGISFEDVYPFANPVEVLGAKSIGQNMIWDGLPPAGWQS